MTTRMLSLLGILMIIALPECAGAAVPPTPCEGLVGCGLGGVGDIANDMLPRAARFLVAVVGAAAVLFAAWAGFQMVLALGNDSKLGEQKWAIVHVLGGVGVAIVAQLLVSTVGTQNYGQGSPAALPRNLIASGVGIILTLFNVALMIAIIVGGIRMVYAQGKSDEFNAGRKIIFWSVVGALVVNLSNALVQAFAGGIFGV